MSSEIVFEYVLGTLRGNERANFEKRCQQNHDLQHEVNYWEEQLMTLNSLNEQLAPKNDTWDAILKKINSPSAQNKPTSKLVYWFTSYVFASLLLFAVGFIYFKPQATPQDQYIAVLTNHKGNATLSALTVAKDKNMKLQWEDTQFPADRSRQLWAISRRDGVARSIAIFNDASTLSLALDKARWRLITDAEFLLLTEEELGGSPLDEPSDNVIAKGACVRYQHQDKT